MLIPRKIEPILKRLSDQYPVITITGPRQSGKTTLCKKVFQHKPYLSLETPDVRRRAMADPNSFLESLQDGAVLDEIQRVPELLSYIQGIVDSSHKPGMFILTGSAQFELLSQINQSLAGRTALLRLMPFSLDEAYPSTLGLNLEKVLYTGFYPGIFDKKLNPTEALGYYVNTYVERDVRSLINVRDLNRFETFIKLCAGRTGQILNFSSLANDCGVNHNTAFSWISVLEASYLMFTLKPHFRNFNKRLMKSPKLHFMDCGLASYLLEIENPRHIKNHPLKGNIFESFIIAELMKQRFNKNKQNNLYYWRDNVGHEIDLIYDFGDILFPVEIKAGKTVTTDYFKNLNFYRKINPNCKKAAIIYGGDKTYYENNIWVVSFKDINLFEDLDYTLKFKIS